MSHPSVVTITDPEDPRVASYRNVRDRDLAGRGDAFVAEGEVVVRRLLTAERHRPASLLIAEKRVEGFQSLFHLLAPETPVYAAAPAVMDAIVGFHIHRGVLAMGQRAAPVEPEDLLASLTPDALVVALCGVSNHDNMGGLFRNAAAFGAQAVLLDAACCDPLYRKAIRVSVGAALTVPFARLDPDDDLVEMLEIMGFRALALSPRGTVTLSEMSGRGPTAAIFGAEGPGLPDEVLERVCTVRIPMSSGFDSLNVATTSGIVLHHLASDRDLRAHF